MKNFMKKIGLALLSALVALQPIASQSVGYSPSGGYNTPIVNTGFNASIAQIGLKSTKSYKFGSAVTAGPGETAITNATQLNTYWSPLNVNAGSVKINSELQAYSTDFVSGQHIFNTDNLQISGTLDGGGQVAPVIYGNLGNNPGINTNSFPASALGISDVSTLAVGQNLIFTYLGQYGITSITGTGGSAVITTTPLFGSGTTIGGGFFTPWQVIPHYYATTNALTAAGSAILHFAAVPAGVANGQFVAFFDNTGNTDNFRTTMNATQLYVVTAHDSTSVTLDKNLNGTDAVANGQGIFFTQPIRSGQIWSRDQYYMPGWNGVTYFAMKVTAKLPPNATPYALSGSISGANPTGQYGGWPAFWCYGGTGGSFANASEIDVFEEYNNILRDTHQIDPNIHQGSSATLAAAVTDFLYNPSTWTLATGIYTYKDTIDYGNGYHDFELLVTPDAAYYFIDDRMIKKTNYHWTSSRPVTVGFNLAIGSFAPGLNTNNLWPLNNAAFPYTLNTKALQIWVH